MKKKKKKDRKEVLHIRRKNYESIKSEIKDRISNQIENNNSNCLFLADYKYVPIILFDRDFSKVKQQNVNEKLKPDIKKQLTYEYALQLQNKHAETKSLFCIPYYFNDHEKVGVGKFQKKLGKEIKKSKIDIFKVNFMLIQQKYIEK